MKTGPSARNFAAPIQSFYAQTLDASLDGFESLIPPELSHPLNLKEVLCTHSLRQFSNTSSVEFF
jgi:hypothetical protein